MRRSGIVINKKVLITDLILFGLIVLLALAVTGFLKQGLVATVAEESYHEVAKEVVAENHTSVDFATVHAKGSSATSWLYVPGTKIDYPLVQGVNNEYYLDRDAYGNPSEAGAIFINFANAADMSDVKTVIFGHNMSNGSMFTDLHKYSDSSFGQVTQNAYIYMENGEVKHYRVLYYIYTEPLDPAVYVVSDMDTLDDANAALKERASITYNEYKGGNLICLSTCSMHKYRTVVVFEYIDNAKPIVGSAAMESALGSTAVDNTDSENEDK